MRRAIISILICLALAPPGARGQGSAPDSGRLAFFESKIRPILVEHCYRCHSVKAQAEKKLKAGLFVDSRMGLIKGGESGPAVVPGSPKEGSLLKALRYTDPDLRMPPKGKLPSAVVADFEKWIAMGAPDPREEKGKAAVIPDLEKARMEHWAFKPI
ncbi:MAG: c-type cytochrome domain-containing protein, partial [Planctomycetota bacterium]